MNGARSTAISDMLNARSEQLKAEKPILIINLAGRKAPLKASDFQFISQIMAFAIKHAKMAEAQALNYAVTTFVLIHAGDTQEKLDANHTADQSFKWSMEVSATKSLSDHLVFQLYCAHQLKKHFGLIQESQTSIWANIVAGVKSWVS